VRRSSAYPVNALPDAEISEGREFVGAVAGKMPMWDADAISRYERVEIATVKADIAMAQQAEEKEPVIPSWPTCQSCTTTGMRWSPGRDAEKGVAYMSSKEWIEEGAQETRRPKPRDSISKRARLAEALLKMKKRKA
jgi:hypothetical protein